MEARRNVRPNSGRAILSLWILIGIMIVSLGALSTTIASSPSPLVGIGFATSALVFLLALILAGRITIALERARRAARPPTTVSESFPILSRVLRRRPHPAPQPHRASEREPAGGCETEDVAPIDAPS
jgi:Kef-type K+ transport system membrane component KefB